MTNPAFIAREYALEFYNGSAVINLSISFFYDDDGYNVVFEFPQFNSAYFRVYDERNGRLIKNFSNITRSSNVLIFNLSASDMTFDDLGTYYYEIGYNRTGYEIPLIYGKLNMI